MVSHLKSLSNMLHLQAILTCRSRQSTGASMTMWSSQVSLFVSPRLLVSSVLLPVTQKSITAHHRLKEVSLKERGGFPKHAWAKMCRCILWKPFRHVQCIKEAEKDNRSSVPHKDVFLCRLPRLIHKRKGGKERNLWKLRNEKHNMKLIQLNDTLNFVIWAWQVTSVTKSGLFASANADVRHLQVMKDPAVFTRVRPAGSERWAILNVSNLREFGSWMFCAVKQSVCGCTDVSCSELAPCVPLCAFTVLTTNSSCVIFLQSQYERDF